MSKVLEIVKEYLTDEELSLFTNLYQEKMKEYSNEEVYKGYKLCDYLDAILYRLAEFHVNASSLYLPLLGA